MLVILNRKDGIVFSKLERHSANLRRIGTVLYLSSLAFLLLVAFRKFVNYVCAKMTSHENAM